MRAIPGSGPMESSSRPQYRFLNPYNFVRFVPPNNVGALEPKTVMAEKLRALAHVTKPPSAAASDVKLMDRCPPPPHDRYLGLTGRIRCTLEAVTPLFVSDSHNVRVSDNKHQSYEFFKVGGQPALPASSLRGMIRVSLKPQRIPASASWPM